MPIDVKADIDSAISPFTLEITPAGNGFKSIKNMTWENVPGFAVLTGLNGSGKTQLLEIIAYRLTVTNYPGMGIPAVNISTFGESFNPMDIAYVPANYNLTEPPPMGLAQMQQSKAQLFQQIQHENNVLGNLNLRVKRDRIQKIVVKPLNQMDFDEFSALLPDDYVYMIDDSDVIASMGHVFVAYRIKLAQNLLSKKGVYEDSVKETGAAPWDVLNETFVEAGFPYKVEDPSALSLADNYTFRLVDIITNQVRNPKDLSSGEKTILQVILWLYTSNNHNRFPKILLLDETDAHLHPSMTQQFINVLINVLVIKHKVRVILATHSPSTVALTPDGCIFEMQKGANKVKLSASKAETLGLLTSGLVLVSPDTRFVLVEDVSDVTFYDLYRDLLSDFGPLADPRALKSAPSIVFLPASTNKSCGRSGGGCTVVRGWIEKLEHDPLKHMFKGVIDLDESNQASDRIYVIERHSVENYLLDPLYIFALLNDIGKAPQPFAAIPQGSEFMLKNLPNDELQKIAQSIVSFAEASDESLINHNHFIFELTSGQKIKYPQWVKTTQGHSLLQKHQRIFAAAGASSTISPHRLHLAVRRTRLVPVEIADLMHTLQSS